MKMMAVWYLLLGISSTFKGETNAYFSDREMINGVIRAGTWEPAASCTDGNLDCSSLEIMEAGIKGQNIYITIVNREFDMNTEGKYTIYFNDNGHPKEGSIITEYFPFKPLKKDESITLTFTPNENGIYMFKVLHHEDHPDKSNLWSEEILIDFLNKVHEEESTKEDDQSQSDLDRDDESVEIEIPIDEVSEIEDKEDVEIGNEDEPEQPSQPKESVHEEERNKEEVSSENDQSDSDLDVNEENQKAEVPNEKDSKIESKEEETEQLSQPEESINKEKQEQSVEEKVKTEAEEPSKDDADAKIEEVELDKKDTDEQVKGE